VIFLNRLTLEVRSGRLRQLPLSNHALAMISIDHGHIFRSLPGSADIDDDERSDSPIRRQADPRRVAMVSPYPRQVSRDSSKVAMAWFPAPTGADIQIFKDITERVSVEAGCSTQVLAV
jgi:hypothetical protein